MKHPRDFPASLRSAYDDHVRKLEAIALAGFGTEDDRAVDAIRTLAILCLILDPDDPGDKEDLEIDEVLNVTWLHEFRKAA